MNAPRQAPEQAGALFSLDLLPDEIRPADREELAGLERAWQEAPTDPGEAGITLGAQHASSRPPWRGALIAVGVLISGLALLVLLSQAAALMDQISRWPTWPARAATAAVLLVVLAVLASLLRLSWVFIRLGRSPRVSTRALRSLAERADMRALSLQRSAEAKRQLKRLLTSYPLGSNRDRLRLSRLGLLPDEIDRLESAARALTSQEGGGDAAWIEQFDRLFLSVLDEAAQRRVNRCAWLVGLKTAAVPGGGFDAAIVMINAYLLIADLCILYNVRTGAWGTATVLVHVVVNALTATQIEDVTAAATDHWAGHLSQHLGGLAAGLTHVAGKVAARVGDGAVNAVLTRRLGGVAIRYLRPIAAHAA